MQQVSGGRITDASENLTKLSFLKLMYAVWLPRKLRTRTWVVLARVSVHARICARSWERTRDHNLEPTLECTGTQTWVHTHAILAQNLARVPALRLSKDLTKDPIQSFPHLNAFSTLYPTHNENTAENPRFLSVVKSSFWSNISIRIYSLQSGKNWLPRKTVTLLNG